MYTSYLVWKEDPGGEVLNPDPRLDHHLLVGEGGVARGRQLGVALPLPLRPDLKHFYCKKCYSCKIFSRYKPHD